jgi:Uma2 family endonuclease
MRVAEARFTRADYELLPEGFPAQLVAGRLVREPSPTYGHSYFSGQLYARLLALVGPARAVHAPQDVGIDEFNVFQPDVLVLREIPPLDVHDVGIPLLALEVLSPSTARRDRRRKLPRYLAAGVAEVWIVDPDAGTVEVHDAAGRRSASGDETIASRAVPGLEVVPAALFAPPSRDA